MLTLSIVGNRLNLYAAGNTKPSTRPNMTLPTGWTSMGCYSDNVGGRTLGFGTQVPGGANNMTNGNCLQACQKAGYTLAGTEYAAEVSRSQLRISRTSADSYKCYCDNSIQAGGGPASDGNAQCNMPCKGDSGQICGGPNRLNLYSFGSKSASSSKSSTTSAKSTGATTSSIASTTSTTPANSPTSVAPTTTAPATTTTSAAPTTTPATTTSVPATSTTSTTSASAQPTVNGFKYQGCYTDTNSTGRSLTYQFPDSQTNTVPSCISQCSGKGYTIAGLQYGTQCFCDNYVANSPQLRPDSECNMACSGDATQKCGAGGRNSIYSSGPLGPRTPPGPLTGSALPTGWNYTGCLKDNINNMRSLPYFMNFPSNNSNTMCINLCQQFGFSVAGTEYGAQVSGLSICSRSLRLTMYSASVETPRTTSMPVQPSCQTHNAPTAVPTTLQVVTAARSVVARTQFHSTLGRRLSTSGPLPLEMLLADSTIPPKAL